MEIGLETVSSLAQAIGALLPVAVVIIFGWAIYRTGSFHVLLAKSWSLISGSKGVTDPAVAAYMDRQHSLATFRFHSGVQSPSLEHVGRLLTWASTKGIQVSEIARAGKYFNHDDFSVKMNLVPSLRWHRIKAWSTLFLLPVMAACALWAIYMGSAYVRFKDDGQGFILSQEYARAYWHDVPVTSQSCASGQAISSTRQTGFSVKQTQSLCAAFKEPASREFLASTIGSQRRSLSYLALSLSVLFLASVSELSRTTNARALNFRLIKLESGNPCHSVNKG